MQARSLLVLFSLKSIFSLYLLYLDNSLSSRHSWHLYVSVCLMSLVSLPFMFRLLIPGPTHPQSRLSKYLLICSFAFVLYAAHLPSWSSPHFRLLIYKL